jgi:hypothetical protein
MKMLKYILGSLILTGLVACSANEDKFPIPLSETLNNTGGIVRIISVETAGLDIADLSGAEYAFIAELSDVNDGQDAEAVAFYAAFRDVDGNRIEELPNPIVVYEASSFTVDPSSGLPRARLSVPLSDLLSDFGLTSSDIDLGDRFEIRWELRMKDGRVFSRNDVATDVSGAGFFNSPFSANVEVVRGLPETMFVGSYTFSQDAPSPSVAGAFANGWLWNGSRNITVTLAVDPDNTLNGRTFTATPLAEFGVPARNYRMQIGFFTTLAANTTTGLGCSPVGIFYGGATQNRGSHDHEDDSTFNLIVVDNVLGDCGLGGAEVSFTATKN